MGPILLFITTFIWGTAFLAQKIGGEAFGPFTVTCLRSILGGTFLLGCIAVRNKWTRLSQSRHANDLKSSQNAIGTNASTSIWGGAICGVPLFAAMLTQQIGIADTTPGISAFLTTNYVLFVPLLGAILARRWPRTAILICALGALAGTYLICITPGAGGVPHVGRGEAWTILCALLFAIQMISVEHFTKKTDVLVMSTAQLFSCALLAAPFMLLPSEPNPLASGALRPGMLFSLFYLGIFSSGIAYTLQNFGQARTNASLAAVICSMESVFGALSGWIALGDTLSPRQFAGCALVFVAALAAALSQLTNSRQGASCQARSDSAREDVSHI